MQLKTLLLIAFFFACALAQTRLRVDIGGVFDITRNRAYLGSPIRLSQGGQYFTSPYDNKVYEIPLEVASISTPAAFVQRPTNIYNTLDEFKQERLRSLGIGHLHLGPDSIEVSAIGEVERNRNLRFAITQQQHILFDIALKHPSSLKRSTLFERVLSDLPPYSAATQKSWYNLFEVVGSTHYVKQMQLGGFIEHQQIADIRNLTRQDEDHLRAQFDLTFSWNTTPKSPNPATNGPNPDPTFGVPVGLQLEIRFSGNPNAGGKRYNHVDEMKRDVNQYETFAQMKSDLRSQLEFIDVEDVFRRRTSLRGGEGTLFVADQWREWVQTIVDRPILVTCTLGSLADLMEGHPLQQDMERAIADRLAGVF